MFKLIKTEGSARRGVFTCAHGMVQTPVFMNVGTQGAIKGALSAKDLEEIGCQVELSNTYHLGQAHSHRLWRVSGVFSGISAKDPGGGRILRLPH